MSLALLFVLVTLAAYRVWRFFAVDDFPPVVGIREWFADRIANRHGSDWADGIGCPWCSGFWASTATVAITWTLHPLPLPGLWFCAVPAALALLASTLDDE